MNRIQTYFNSIAEGIEIDARRAGTSQHRADIGLNRETFINVFLQRHLPKRLSASLGGQIIGTHDTHSGQIDIIVSSDISIRFEENERSFVTAESVAAVITVKSYLDKANLEDCLQNLASIPQLSPDVLKFDTLKTGAFDNFVAKHPSLYVFAYDGVNSDTCSGHIADFYNGNSGIPRNRLPLGIIVNKKYMLKHIKEPAKMLDGTEVPAHSIYPSQLQESNYGWPFVHMVNDITSYVSWLPYMTINAHHYFNSSFYTVGAGCS